MMKKIYAVLLVAFMAVILSACASKEAWLKVHGLVIKQILSMNLKKKVGSGLF